MDAGDLLDCRNADAPMLEIELLEGKVRVDGCSHVDSELSWDALNFWLVVTGT